MPYESSIEDLRSRLRKDPASIAFAQLAEELRRAGQFTDAVTVCQTGLAIYPEYLSARVTMGRALIELGRFDEARRELDTVLVTAPEHLAATRALADIQGRRATGDDSVEPVAKVALTITTHQRGLPTADEGRSRRAARTVAALEAWLSAINVTRAQPSA